MNMRSVRVLMLVALSAVVLGGCVERVGRFTFLSTRNVDFSRIEDYRVWNEEVVGVHRKPRFLFIFSGEPDHQVAMDAALNRISGGKVMRDVVLENVKWSFFGLFGQKIARVRGQVLYDPIEIGGVHPAGAVGGNRFGR